MECEDLPDIQKEASDLFTTLEKKTETVMGCSDANGYCLHVRSLESSIQNGNKVHFAAVCVQSHRPHHSKYQAIVLLFVFHPFQHGFEYGCSEVGKSEDVVASKKEVVETYLHSPKTMKDLFDRITQEADYDLQIIGKLKIVCFNNTGLRMKLSVMDCPKGYVCRVQETEEYKIPTSVKSLAAQIIPMLTLTLQAKNKPKGKPQLKAKKAARKQQEKEQIVLPSSLTTFTTSTTARKRKNEETN
ncbi:hypothetical protein INT45_001267 [Circinella minor]|uniref:Uncharacterized protein n=1 Tax=Circinella minor TaxID=1195481 RepID=A0A8H7RTW5_9FUNG|nr:hypothetical protein INT45_001267 [Circinella minor]